MTSEPTQPVAQDTFKPVPPEPGPYEVPAQAVAPTRPRSRSAVSWVNVALGLALAVAVGGVAFAAGRMTAPAAAAANGAGNGRFNQGFPGGGYFGGQTGPGGQGRTFGGGGASIQGTVTAVTADSITIQTAGGQSITIALDSATTYHQQASASSGDVKTGGTVIVRLGLREPNATGGQTTPSASDVTIVPQ